MSFGSSKWNGRTPSLREIMVTFTSCIVDEEPSLEVIKAVWDLGINTIDNPNFLYSNGESERVVHEATYIQL